MKIKFSEVKNCLETVLHINTAGMTPTQMVNILKSFLLDSKKRGNVYIGAMNLRGKRAEKPENTISVNVTSAQATNSMDRRDFSPMTEIIGGYKGYWNFESYWQSGKVFEGIPDQKAKKWWKDNKEAKRRYPKSKGKKVLYAQWEGNPEKMDYVTSRKKIYIPEYFELIKVREATCKWRKEVDSGKDIMIYDFDGPRDKDGNPICLEVTPEMMRAQINDPRFPFGHGYIIASWLANIRPEEYI